MDTTINTNIEATTDISNTNNVDAFADLDDDPPGLYHTRADQHFSEFQIVRFIKKKIGIITHLILGSLVGGMTGSYIGFPSVIVDSNHNQCIFTAGCLTAKVLPLSYKIG